MQESLRIDLTRLDRRDRWLHWTGMSVILLLTAAVVSLSVPALRGEDSFFEMNLSQAVRALVGMILLFNIYSIYQHSIIRRLRSQLATQIGVMARLETQTQELYKQAVLDPLTGLHNRRSAEERMALEIARAHRQGRPFTVLVFDLDDFKSINDRHGHAAGDLALKEFGERLNRVVRSTDLAARIGGDEFVALLPECPAGNISHLLARLGSIEVEFQGHPLKVKYSVGHSSYQPGDKPAQLMARADEALYQNKRNGRNLPRLTAGAR